MKSQRQLKNIHPELRELIDSLWREYPGLYNEKYASTSSASEWLKNVFGEDVEFGQAMGQDHALNGNQSSAIGIGAITRAFREIVLGSYATDADPVAEPVEAWNELDRLLTIGNGLNDANRSDAFILFKSGLLELKKAIKIGPFPELAEGLPKDGTLQYSLEKSLEIWENEKWNAVKDKFYRHTQSAPSRVWEIQHNLGKYPSISITDFAGNEYEGEANRMDENTIILTFSAPLAGYADLN